jgi:hypothetical protein
MRPRATGWAIWLLVGVLVAGLGAALLVVGLDDADKYASVAGAVSALVGLGVSLSALVRRQPQRPLPSEGPPKESRPGQTVASSNIGGDVIQIGGIQGSARIQRPPASPDSADPHQEPTEPPAAPAPEQQGTQTVKDSRIAGSALQIGHVGGNVDIERTSDG